MVLKDGQQVNPDRGTAVVGEAITQWKSDTEEDGKTSVSRIYSFAETEDGNEG